MKKRTVVGRSLFLLLPVLQEKRDRFLGRDFHYILGLGSFRAVGHLEFNFLPLDQSFVAIAGDRAVMHEYILLAGLFYKTVTLSIVEPFDQTDCFRHCF